MARVLIVGGGCRGRRLASEYKQEGHAVRMTTRDERGRAAIEAAGAECWIGTPDRIGTLRHALAGVTIVCWALGTVSGGPEQVEPLHGSRLQFMLGQVIDTPVRGFVYEAAGTVPAATLARGAALVRAAGELHSIPYAQIEADPTDATAWLQAARAAIDSLLQTSK